MSDLIARFDASVHDSWETHPAPIHESVSTIEKHFGCRLPPMLLQLASESRSFSSFFLGLGPDFDSHTHIIQKNHLVRSNKGWVQLGPAPRASLVLITDNFMNDFFWCMDTSKPTEEHPIVLWSPNETANNTVVYSSFENFIQATIEFYEAKVGS